MARDDDLLTLEREFWKGDAEFYRRRLSDHAVMVFPEPTGVLTRDQVLAAIGAAPRWADVQMDDPRLVALTNETAILTYKATARREGDATPYIALVSSVYVNGDGRWLLAFHQHTVGAT